MSSEDASAKAKRILVVDDNPIILNTLTPRLKSKGYEVQTAADGSEAISHVRKAKPDLVLLDISFPPDVAHGGGVGWDGFVIMQWIRRTEGAAGIPGIEVRLRKLDDIPIFIISVTDPEKVKDKALAAGAQGFFHKPIDLDALLAAIEKTLKP